MRSHFLLGTLVSVVVWTHALVAPAEAGGERTAAVRTARRYLKRAIALEKDVAAGGTHPAGKTLLAQSLRKRARARLAEIGRGERWNRDAAALDADADSLREQARAADAGLDALVEQYDADERAWTDFWNRERGTGDGRPARRQVSLSLVSRAQTRRALVIDPARVKRSDARWSSGLGPYARTFGPRFTALARGMTRRDVWVDIGTSSGAHDEYKGRFGGPARTVRVDVYQPPGPPLPRRATVLTDYYDAMSFHPRPDQVLERYGALVKRGGLVILAVKGTTVMRSADGKSSEGILAYLGRVKGFEVESGSSSNLVFLRRTGARVRAPGVELLDDIDARIFRVTEPTRPPMAGEQISIGFPDTSHLRRDPYR